MSGRQRQARSGRRSRSRRRDKAALATARGCFGGVGFADVERACFDVVFCGGGLAGLCGAVLAARQGLHVALVQDRPVLGGNSSSEVRVHVHGAGTYWPWAVETGVIAELIDEERFRNPEPVFEGGTNAIWDLVLYEWATREPTLALFLSTSVRGVEMASSGPGGAIAAVRCSQLGNEKEFALAAPLFVDATGDGTVAALAGAEWRMGREARGEFGEPTAPQQADNVTQGSSLQFRARDVGRPVPFVAPDWAVEYPDEESLYCRRHDDPRGGYWWIEIGSPLDTLADNEAVRHELLRHVLGVFDHLKNRGRAAEHGAENLTLDWVGPVPGKRETRRVLGPHILTENDLRSRRLFEDRVAYGGWFLDEHVAGGLLAADQKPERSVYDFDRKDLQQVGPYSIGLSSLRCRDVGNLFLAGRDLSASHIALMSARVMGTCAVMGQAVGAAAVVCHRRGCLPQELTAADIHAVQQLLLKEDCYVPHVANSDPADLARAAEVTATSSAPLVLGPGGAWLELTCPTEQVVPITAGRVDAVELLLANRNESAVELTLSLRRRPMDIWDSSGADEVGACAATVAPTGEDGSTWVRFAPAVEVAPGLYGVKLGPSPGVFWAQRPQGSASPPPGTAVATFRPSGCWRFEGLRGHWPAQAMRLAPASRPFEPANVVNGVARPQQWANLWMSDPAAGLPQTLTLELADPAEVAEVRLAFDSNLGRNLRATPGNFVAPELVRDYRIESRRAGRWETVLEQRGNRRRHRVHRFAPRPAEAVRLIVLATHGVPEARLYEVRLYGP